eukprot:552709-Hanusia_phi.AAC.1
MDSLRGSARPPGMSNDRAQETQETVSLGRPGAGGGPARRARISEPGSAGRAPPVQAPRSGLSPRPVSYTHLRAHETVLDL